MQSLYILLVIILGILIPQAHSFTWLIRFSLLTMLFFAFLGVSFRRDLWHRHHLLVLGLNLLLPLVIYWLLRPLHDQIALATFVVAMAPTAAGAPVIAALLRCRVDFVTGSVLLTSPAVAVVLPLLLPHFLPVEGRMAVMDILLPVGILVFGPLLLSQAIRRYSSRLTARLSAFSGITFWLFLLNVFLACARASHFIRHENQTTTYLLPLLGLAIALLCVVQFQLGERLGGRAFALESSLGLGRKNTMFALWVALTFVGPVAAMGPIFYIIFQNLYNSWQMFQVERSERRAS